MRGDERDVKCESAFILAMQRIPDRPMSRWRIQASLLEVQWYFNNSDRRQTTGVSLVPQVVDFIKE